MKVLDSMQTLQALAKALGKPCMFVSFQSHGGEVLRAAPYLEGCDQVLCDGQAFVVFDSEEELEKAYFSTVGDDGPTELNSYAGPARVYALTCGADGELRTENT